MRRTHFVKWVPYWRSRLGPTSKLWAGVDYMEHHEGLFQGFPISSSGFSFTIHDRVKEADMRLVELGGCARFGMDDGYMIGPPELVFEVLAEFAARIKEDSGCELNVSKCRMYSKEEGACEAARKAGHIPVELLHLKEGVHVNESGDLLRGLTIFNVPVGEEKYVAVKLRDKAKQVEKTTEAYVRDRRDEYPKELWTMLQFSLQHRITY